MSVSAIDAYIAAIMPKMDGWCSSDKARSLAAHVLEAKPRICVEIGVYAGRSFFAIALALRELGVGYLLGIDPWHPLASVDGTHNQADKDWWGHLDHGAIYQQFCRYRKELGVEANTEVFVGSSDQATPCMRMAAAVAGGPFIDLVHIDGNHSLEHALADVETYVPLVVPGGMIYFDDLDWATTKPAQEKLATMCELLPPVGTCGRYRRR